MLKTGSQGVIVRRGTGDGLYVYLQDAPFEDGDKIRFVVRPDEDSAAALTKEITTFTEDGKAFVQFTEQDTLSLSSGDYVYGVNLKKAGQAPAVIVRSALFRVEEAVARDE